MNYPKEYFQKEVIEGFEVSEMMKRCWAAQMEVLETFDAICKKHSIRYFFAYGSLIGAVRHKGFIPWDDDIDIWMMPGDLDKLINETAEDFAAVGLELVTPFSDKEFGNIVYRLINTRNYCLRENFLKKYWLFPFMAGLDIMTLNYLPRNEKKRKELETLMGSAWWVAENWNNPHLPEKEKVEVYYQLMEKIGKKPAKKDDIPNHLWKMVNYIGGMCQEKDADMMTIWGNYLHNPAIKFSKKCFEKTVYLDFDMAKVPCPEGYDEVLTAMYGPNYMTPRKWTAAHDYPYYKDAHARLMSDFNELGINCPAIFKSL